MSLADLIREIQTSSGAPLTGAVRNISASPAAEIQLGPPASKHEAAHGLFHGFVEFHDIGDVPPFASYQSPVATHAHLITQILKSGGAPATDGMRRHTGSPIAGIRLDASEADQENEGLFHDLFGDVEDNFVEEEPPAPARSRLDATESDEKDDDDHDALFYGLFDKSNVSRAAADSNRPQVREHPFRRFFKAKADRAAERVASQVTETAPSLRPMALVRFGSHALVTTQIGSLELKEVDANLLANVNFDHCRYPTTDLPSSDPTVRTWEVEDSIDDRDDRLRSMLFIGVVQAQKILDKREERKGMFCLKPQKCNAVLAMYFPTSGAATERTDFRLLLILRHKISGPRIHTFANGFTHESKWSKFAKMATDADTSLVARLCSTPCSRDTNNEIPPFGGQVSLALFLSQLAVRTFPWNSRATNQNKQSALESLLASCDVVERSFKAISQCADADREGSGRLRADFNRDAAALAAIRANPEPSASDLRRRSELEIANSSRRIVLDRCGRLPPAIDSELMANLRPIIRSSLSRSAIEVQFVGADGREYDDEKGDLEQAEADREQVSAAENDDEKLPEMELEELVRRWETAATYAEVLALLMTPFRVKDSTGQTPVKRFRLIVQMDCDQWFSNLGPTNLTRPQPPVAEFASRPLGSMVRAPADFSGPARPKSAFAVNVSPTDPVLKIGALQFPNQGDVPCNLLVSAKLRTDQVVRRAAAAHADPNEQAHARNRRGHARAGGAIQNHQADALVYPDIPSNDAFVTKVKELVLMAEREYWFAPENRRLPYAVYMRERIMSDPDIQDALIGTTKGRLPADHFIHRLRDAMQEKYSSMSPCIEMYNCKTLQGFITKGSRFNTMLTHCMLINCHSYSHYLQSFLLFLVAFLNARNDIQLRLGRRLCARTHVSGQPFRGLFHDRQSLFSPTRHAASQACGNRPPFRKRVRKHAARRWTRFQFHVCRRGHR